MRRYAFILSILGILFLISLLIFLPPKQLSSPSELTYLLPNQKIALEGKVISQNSQTLKLETGFYLSCPSCPEYKNKTVSAICRIDTYNNRTYLEVLRIKTKD